MSSCIKDLLDYNLIKVCSKCGIIQLKMNFYKAKKYKDGLKPCCKSCYREYCNETRDQKCDYSKRYYQENLENTKRYYRESRDHKREYQNNRRQTDPM